MTMLGKHHNAATRAAQSAAALAQWANPKMREKTMAAMVEAPMALPPMTAEQRTVYEKLRRIVGRDEALRTAIPGATG